MQTLYILSSVVLVSLVSFVGIFTLSIRQDLIKKYIYLFVSLAIGALLGDAFMHLIPEGMESSPNEFYFPIALIVGILIFFLIERYMHWHHHYEDKDLHETEHPVGKMIIISDGLHNFIDGLIIGASYMASTEIGVATTIAVILHEVPQEIGDFGVLIHAGYSRAKALWYNFLSATTSVIGAVIVILAGRTLEDFSTLLIPIAAGGFIYIALSDLIPELKRDSHSKLNIAIQLIMIAVGVLAMASLHLLESAN